MTAGLTVREAAEVRFRACQENEVREILPERQLDDDLLHKPFVVDGLRNVPASLPAPGRRVWIHKQIGLVTTDPQAHAEGKIAVALFSMQKKGRHRNAPLSTVVTRRVWPWDVREVRDEELADSTEPGRWLTLGMVHAVQAVKNAPTSCCLNTAINMYTRGRGRIERASTRPITWLPKQHLW
jgi:hypothetical protein